MAHSKCRTCAGRAPVQPGGDARRLEALCGKRWGCEFELARLECFDISHTHGEATVAPVWCSAKKAASSRTTVATISKGITPGDDYAALHQALTRRYIRLRKKKERLPDILFIDGGKGQLTQAGEVLDELGIAGVVVVGIAKGPGASRGWRRFTCSRKIARLYCPPIRPPCIWCSRSATRRTASRSPATASAGQGTHGPPSKVFPVSDPNAGRRCSNNSAALKQLARAGVEDIAQWRDQRRTGTTDLRRLSRQS
jgi:excinuclease ABC subunit C